MRVEHRIASETHVFFFYVQGTLVARRGDAFSAISHYSTANDF